MCMPFTCTVYYGTQCQYTVLTVCHTPPLQSTRGHVHAMYLYSALWHTVSIYSTDSVPHTTFTEYQGPWHAHTDLHRKYIGIQWLFGHSVQYWTCKNFYINFYDWYWSPANMGQLHMYIKIKHLGNINPSRCKNLPEFLSSVHFLEKMSKYCLFVFRRACQIAESDY
jgi:hypothetical protein